MRRLLFLVLSLLLLSPLVATTRADDDDDDRKELALGKKSMKAKRRASGRESKPRTTLMMRSR